MDLKAEQVVAQGPKGEGRSEKRSLREYEEEQKVPLAERISEGEDS